MKSASGAPARGAGRTRSLCVAAALAIGTVAGAPAANAFNLEAFAGYYFPEELDEDLNFGVRFGNRSSEQFGWQVGGTWFDVEDSQGFEGSRVDLDLFHVDFSFMWYPNGGDFALFAGPGFATVDLEIPFTNQDFSDDVFAAHVGLSYEFGGDEGFYVKPDTRLHWYEAEGFGPGFEKETQITYDASIALGWRF